MTHGLHGFSFHVRSFCVHAWKHGFKITTNLCAAIKFELVPPCVEVSLRVSKTEDTTCLGIVSLVVFFLFMVVMCYMGWYSHVIILIYTSVQLCISCIFLFWMFLNILFISAYSETKKLNIISRKICTLLKCTKLKLVLQVQETDCFCVGHV